MPNLKYSRAKKVCFFSSYSKSGLQDDMLNLANIIMPVSDRKATED